MLTGIIIFSTVGLVTLYLFIGKKKYWPFLCCANFLNITFDGEGIDEGDTYDEEKYYD